MRSTWTADRRRRRGAALVLLALAGVAAVGLVACGGSASSGNATPAGGQSAAGDSFTDAWPKAAQAMKGVAPDALLIASGTTGLALAEVPDSWSFTYFSPEKGAVYGVNVEHGKAGTPQQLGTVKKDVKVKNAIDAASINVGGSQAIVAARAFGEKKGTVPKNVLVGGVFAELPGGVEAGYTPGIWTVVFASGTDLADAQTYAVNMTTGEVAKVKKN